MRIRQVKPAFWSDAKLAELPEATRLFYVGLWMIADDAGWLRWDPVEVGRDLYGYETRRRRERRVQAMYDQLIEAGRVLAYDCGHGFIPKLTDHQHLAGLTRRVETVKKDHQSTCPPQLAAGLRGTPPIPADPRSGKDRLGKERVRNGSALARDEEGEPTEFERLLPRRVALA